MKLTNNNDKKIFVDERKKLKQAGVQPTGINSHLENFKTFLEWRKKYKELFVYDDKAKDLI